MSGKEVLEQLLAINRSCREALAQNDFQKLQAILDIKKDLMKLLKSSQFSKDDISEIEQVLRDEEELARLVLLKKRSLVEFMNVSNFN
ncbi:hypothetical protein [Thermodesulfatator autotrophicus]|uniref:Flagellar protein FliT n=1 Tax=Thermodesulfatator autotrophicus TaxID=1795632 RepID=A0A177EAA7_9BACT|nr:hypothetical protein [Thermodesulfatator autotrophicus]OAG28132.1 hypothetical protein TH606_03055 [Thermodesulfatator autotrophicus]